ncbi:leucyl aminopeptidase [Gulosibacter molinativorax]|uniref:Probable cytosol aminopeptidase n=1 Tax=Gulosibacter molinativorax TaxID=256821 RepID=A0ABT7C4M5_9MICO|nr:leucyl aminopeptidase [Gulosibacter molinativorax]MDJ1370163.1 leucyl aminopeptidase [Gulosibacter molinativorax]QUY61574.1 Probable cytosol aminopeptidase [Gulosibacter molinativorax]
MTNADFELDAKPYSSDTLTVVPVLAGDEPTLLGSSDLGLDAARLDALGVTGKAGATQRILVAAEHGEGEAPVLLIGIGEERDLEALRRAAGVAARALAKLSDVTYDLAEASAEEVAALATGHALGGYVFDRFKSAAEEDADEPSVQKVGIVSSDEGAEAAVAKTRVIIDAVRFTRDLVNTPPNALVPEEFAEIVTAVLEDSAIAVEVWDEPRLIDEGCGGITGVGQGSANPPRLVHLEYAPEDAKAHVALVGKGITFDSGGLSLKPPASMVGMKFDMSGAASVVGVIRAVAALELPVRLSGWCALAENMPSATALKPDDVITMRSKTTVEVTNTDAEGRLVLADGLALASEQQPDVVIDIATLTGAQVVALGDRTTGLMGNNEEWRERILTAAERVGEPTWAMPIPEEIREKLDSNVADIVNAKPGDRSGGMLFAAAFLEKFVGDGEDENAIPWVHLDIAGPADTKSAYGYVPKGATGVPVRTLVEAISSLA